MTSNSNGTETVRYYDVETGEITDMLLSELPPGVMQVQIEGIEGVVWISPEHLSPGPLQHGPFEEGVRELLRQIRDAFIEHRNLTLEVWEDGFRRDNNPEYEIALWLHAAGVYVEFAEDESSAVRRREIYGCVLACMSAGPDTVWQLFEPDVLTQTEAEQIVGRFYRRDPGKLKSSP